MNNTNERIQHLTSCLYAAIHTIGGSIRITKKQLESLPPTLDISVHVEEDTGDLIITTDVQQGEPN